MIHLLYISQDLRMTVDTGYAKRAVHFSYVEVTSENIFTGLREEHGVPIDHQPVRTMVEIFRNVLSDCMIDTVNVLTTHGMILAVAVYR